MKCPTKKCRGFISLEDIGRVFEEEELKEVEEYNEQYVRKSYVRFKFT